MKIHSGLFAFEMQIDGAYGEMRVWRWVRLNVDAWRLCLWRGFTWAHDGARVREGVECTTGHDFGADVR